MKEEFQYRSTPDGKPPTGRKKSGTFRNITLCGVDPKLIDAFDMDCQERNMTRWEFATNVLLAHPEDGGDEKRFYEIFSKTSTFKCITDGMKKNTGIAKPKSPIHQI